MTKPKKWRYFLVSLLAVGLLLSLTGMAQAAVSVSGTSQEELTATYDRLNQSVNNGDWYSNRNNESGTLAWHEGPVMYSYLRMYEATGDTKYLDRLVSHADNVLQTRDSVRGVTDYRGLSLPAWRAGGRYTEGGYYIFAAHTGMIVAPLADFARIVKEENLQQYQDKAEKYITAARKAVAVHDDEWVDKGDVGYYKIRKGAPMWSDGVGVPFNMNASMGETLVSLYQATGDSTYLEKATKMARHFKNHLSVDSSNSYIWNYWYGKAYTGWTEENSPSVNTPSYKGYRVKEDTRHGVVDMRFVKKAYDAGIVFNREDMVRFGNTVTNKLIKSYSSVARFVDGSGTEDSIMRLTPWTMLYPWADEILTIDRRSPYNAAVGMAGLSLYCKAMSDINNWEKENNGGEPANPGEEEPTPPEDEEPGNGEDTTPPGDEEPGAEELVVNGNFTSERDGWDVGSAGEVKTDRNGNHFISNGYNWSLGQDLQLENGARYVFNARTRKGSADNGARLIVVGINNNRIIMENKVDLVYDHNGSDWESIPEQEFTVPSNAEKVRIYLLVDGGSGTHDFDNISLKKIQDGANPGDGENTTPPGDEEPGAEELVVNGNFTSERDGWDVGSAGEVKTDRNGNHFISNGYNWSLGQDLQLENGARYVFNARTRKGSADNGARLIVVGISADNRIINENKVDLVYNHNGSGWESIPEQEFTVPENAAKVRIYLLVNGGSGTHDFDNVSLKKIQDNTPPGDEEPGAGELVVNGNFTGGRGGWNVGNAGEVKTGQNGNHFISNGYNWSLGQDLQLENGARYVFNARTRKGSADNGARLIVVGINNNRIINENKVDLTYDHSGSGWENIPEQEFTVPANAEKVRIYLLVNGGSGTHDFDNISLQKA